MVKFIGTKTDKPDVHVQCEQSIPLEHYTEWYQGHRKRKMEALGKNPYACGHFATYEIEGRNLCTRHAGPIALKILSELDKE